MRARAGLRAVADPATQRTHLENLRSESPLALRETPQGVFLVSSAQAPLGGDELMLDVEIGELAELVLTSTAATLALPGPGGEPSEFVVSVEVGERGSFSWLPEPMVLVGGCDHHTVTTISLAKGARLVWREEFVLGRHDEEPGSGMLDVRIDYDGRPLLRTGSRAGPRWQSWPTPAVASDARAVGMFVLVDPGLDGGLRVEEEVAPGCVLTSLDGPALVVSALASSAIELREMLDAGRREAQTVVNS